jgi:YVTN family beta-propeller protein
LLLMVVLLLAGAARQIARERQPTFLRPGLHLYAYAANTGDGTVTAVDLVGLTAVATIPVGPAPSGLRAHPTRDEIWGVSTTGGYVWVIEAHRGAVAAQIPVGQGAFAIEFSPDGRTAYVAASSSGTVSAIDCASRKVTATIRPGRQPWLARVAPDGAAVVVTNRGDATVAVLDPATLRLQATIPVASRPEQIAILRDRPIAFVSAAGTNQISVVHLKKRALLANLPLSARATDLILSGRGELYVATPETNGITIVDTWMHVVSENRVLGSAPSQGVLDETADGANPTLYLADPPANQIRPMQMQSRTALRPIQAGQRPVTARLSPAGDLLLVVNEESEDLAIIRTQMAPAKSPAQRDPLLTFIPLGRHPRDLAIKVF